MEKVACRINDEFEKYFTLICIWSKFLFEFLVRNKKIQLGFIYKGIELGSSNYRETKSNELSFILYLNDYPI